MIPEPRAGLAEGMGPRVKKIAQRRLPRLLAYLAILAAFSAVAIVVQWRALEREEYHRRRARRRAPRAVSHLIQPRKIVRCESA